MSPDEIELIAAMMVRYRLAEVTVGDVTIKKTIHEIEQPPREPRERPAQRDPMDEEPLDDEVLFHSTQAVHATVDNLIKKREASKPDA